MNVVRLLPVLICTLLLAAHFYRAGYTGLVIMLVVSPLILFVRQPFSARIMQVILVAGGVEWVRTTIQFVTMRQSMGMPWIRLAVILGAVSLITFLSALVFRMKALQERYHLEQFSSAGVPD